jgi:hypothetical protein
LVNGSLDFYGDFELAVFKIVGFIFGMIVNPAELGGNIEPNDIRRLSNVL